MCKKMVEIQLCGRPGKCCPVFAKEGRKYSISDKGQTVKLTKTQLMVLVDTVKRWGI